MVVLDMLSDIVTQLAKTCGTFNNSTIIFGDLLIVKMMDDFYQFPYIEEHDI